MIYFLFFISGASGLILEIIWVRQFGNLFGNTIHSASLVTSVFMFGIGLGSLIAGIISDRKFGAKPEFLLKLYAYFEIGIGIMAISIALLITKLELLSPKISAYVIGSGGWYELSWGSYMMRYMIAVVMLTPIVLLMGGTLTLLIRFLVAKNIQKAGWKIGVLYAANTAGASMGCFLVDFVFIPNMGLMGTQALAVVFNFIAGFGALRMYSSIKKSIADTGTREIINKTIIKVSTVRDTCQTHAAVTYTTIAIFLSGFAGMGMEIIWFRFLTSVMGMQRSTFSLLLTVILIGIWLGSVAGGYADRKIGRPGLLFLICQGLFASSTLIMFLFFDPDIANADSLKRMYLMSSDFVRLLIESWYEIRAVFLLVMIPAFFMGTAYPLANAMIQKSETVIGKRAGILYLSNTVGAVMGSFCAAFIFLPNIGIKNSVFLLSLFSFATMIFIYISFLKSNQGNTNTKASRPIAVVSYATLIICLIVWNFQPSDYILKKIYPNKKMEDKIIHLSEGLTNSIAVTEIQGGDYSRILYVDGRLMAGTGSFPQRYMRAFSHIPLLHIDKPKRVLIICFGVGTTAHAASLYSSVEKIEIVDLSKHVMKQAPYFSKWNKDILKDPRVAIYVNDGRQHLRMQKMNFYDLVTLEPPPISSAGVASLYSKEFYQLVNAHLKEGGFLTQWLPAYQIDGSIVKSMVRAFLDVFPNCILLSGNKRQLILVGRKDEPIIIDPEMLNARIQANTTIKRDLEKYSLSTVTEFIGTFVASRKTLADAVWNSYPVTDDYPIMEYTKNGSFRETVIPHDLFNLSKVNSWCPKCFEKGVPILLAKNLDSYLQILGRWYKSDNFLFSSSIRKSPPLHFNIPDNVGKLDETYRQSKYLKTIFKRYKRSVQGTRSNEAGQGSAFH